MKIITSILNKNENN